MPAPKKSIQFQACRNWGGRASQFFADQLTLSQWGGGTLIRAPGFSEIVTALKFEHTC